jgi:hypothetical protein
MKRIHSQPVLEVTALIAFMLGNLPVLAQSPELPLRLAAERQQIQAQRVQIESVDQQEQAACNVKFAVFDCLRDVRIKRRLAMDELRRQELLLNDIERQGKGMDALKRIQENASPERQEERAQQQQQALQAQQQRQIQFDEKQTPSLAPPVASSPTPENMASPASNIQLEQQRYQEKLQQALQHKIDKEKSLGETKSGKKLPIPAGL